MKEWVTNQLLRPLRPIFFIYWQSPLLAVNVVVVVVICVIVLLCRLAQRAQRILLHLNLPLFHSAFLYLYFLILSWWFLVDLVLTWLILCLKCMSEMKATLDWIIKKFYQVVHVFNLKRCLNLEIVYSKKKKLPWKYSTSSLNYYIDPTLLYTFSIIGLPPIFGIDHCLFLEWRIRRGCWLCSEAMPYKGWRSLTQSDITWYHTDIWISVK